MGVLPNPQIRRLIADRNYQEKTPWKTRSPASAEPVWRQKSELRVYTFNHMGPRATQDKEQALQDKEQVLQDKEQAEISAATQQPQQMILPTLFGEGSGIYDRKPANFLVSVVVHALALAAILFLGRTIEMHPRELRKAADIILSPPPFLSPSKTQSGGGGGGGDRDLLRASKGAPPKPSLEDQKVPPAVIIRNDKPKLIVQPTIVVPPEVKLPQDALMGDPLKGVLGPPSNGVGANGGIGNGAGGGVGSGDGRGFGPGRGGGTGGGYFHVGGGVTAPRAIYSPDPEYSEEARKAKYQGTVVLWIIVGPDGKVHDARIQRSVGLGLDEKAIEAVREWKFDPAQKDGHPVAVAVSVEVNFHLY